MIIKEVQDQFMVKLNNLIVNNKIVKIENISKNLIENLNHFFKELFFNSFKFSFLNSNVNALDNLISLLAQGILYIVSIKKILDNEITIGQLTIIITYFNLILNSIKYLFSTIKSYQNIKVCYDRVNELMLISKEKFGNIRPSSISSIQLKNISFCYQEKLVISNFSYTFRKNNIYCIKGKNGSGKTTLIKILLGLYSDIYEGEVLYNENNIIKNDLCYLRLNNISYLDQNIDSYNYLDIKTVNENGCLEETFDNLKNSNSKNVYVSKNGKNITDIATLSRGEKQKKLIIQALAKKADVIILDEPTAALDLESKVAFLKLITSIKANKIIILISHDEEIIRIADYTINSLEFNTIIEPS
jgi:ATP-binding cassette subfamily C protein